MVTSYQSLFSRLQPGDTILTVNQRLSSYLRQRFNDYQQRQGHTFWQTPDILPLTTWIERCWLECSIQNDTVRLLKSFQEIALWQEIISTSKQGEELLNVNAAVEMAKTAWELCKQWHIDIHAPEFSYTENTSAWQEWSLSFQQHCSDNHWLDTSSLLDHISEQIHLKAIVIPERFYFIGFDEFNPQQQSLLNALKKQGCDYQLIELSSAHAQIKSINCTDSEAELQHMAHWAYELWKKNPAVSIGCIVPNLTEIRPQLVNTFTAVFMPENFLPGHAHSVPFNISGGKNLHEFPLINTALQIIKINESIALEDLTRLLTTPYIGYAEQEMTTRAQLDVKLHQAGENKIFLRQIITAAKNNNCPQLASQLQNFIKNPHPIKNAPSEWITYFINQLSILGWPGERTLNSIEYQQYERWCELLNEYATLDVILGEISAQKALRLLTELAASIVFQPKSDNVPIQILGVLEAAGMEFDHLWIWGLHSNAWPAPARPNPFIPKDLQRKKEIPHSTQRRELRYCKIMTQRLCQSAAEIYLSYPEFDQDQKLHPSPLIEFMQAQPITLPAVKLKNYSELIQESALIDCFEDDYAPVISTMENIMGGSSIFKEQAACPFRANAHFRLGAKTLPLPDTGLNAIERGSLIHQVMEIFWNTVNSQQKLLTLNEDELKEIINQSIDTALTAATKKRAFTFKIRFKEIEKKRLYSILKTWLEEEKKRPPFKVWATELSQNYSIAHISFNLRIDRIDQLDENNYMLIDYKTGNVSLESWFGDRPDEPQLPLYCTANPLAISGLLFAQIRASNLQFKGISAHTSQIKGVTSLAELKNHSVSTNWEELKAYWRSVLENLGQQFQSGYAKVDPKNGDQTCRQCDLHILCRRFDNN